MEVRSLLLPIFFSTCPGGIFHGLRVYHTVLMTQMARAFAGRGVKGSVRPKNGWQKSLYLAKFLGVVTLVLLVAAAVIVLGSPWWYTYISWRKSTTSFVSSGPGVSYHWLHQSPTIMMVVEGGRAQGQGGLLMDCLSRCFVSMSQTLASRNSSWMWWICSAQVWLWTPAAFFWLPNS